MQDVIAVLGLFVSCGVGSEVRRERLVGHVSGKYIFSVILVILFRHLIHNVI